jgi:cytochrome P450
VHPYAIQRDPRNFTDPEKFWPDRWLIAAGSQPYAGKLIHSPAAFIPFSYGPANCVGKNLALLEMRMLICHFMQKLEVRFVEGWNRQKWLDGLEDVFVSRTGELPVLLRRRV